MFNGTLLRLAAIGIVGVALPVAAEEKGMKVVFEHDGDPVYRVLPPGTIPAIDEPRFVRGPKANGQMSPGEPVFGLILGDEKRAYSLWQLDQHEVVNDRIGETAFAATW